ncbi:benzoate 4-monooxygenase cytochrome P450 [Xylariales sp. AK1849]|nr:benzoate 4-monooxygenase cytochrome P450 [Xylariales sp. AK1849]
MDWQLVLSSLSWRSLLATILLALISIIVDRRYLSSLNRIPGPFLASFSRLWHIGRILAGDQNRVLVQLHDQHGHFVRIAHNEVSVSHPDGVKKILLAPLHKNPVSTTDPKKKIERSRNLGPGYSMTNILLSERAIDQNIQLLRGWLDKYATSAEPMDLDKFFTFTTHDNVGELVFSKSFGFLREGRDICDTIWNSLAHNAYVAVMGFYGWVHTVLVGNPFVTWLGILPYGHIVDTAMAAVKERGENPDTRFDLMSHWLKALAEHPDRMNIREVHATAFNNTAAGGDTVACGLQSFFYHMIRHPTAWQRVRDEITGAGLAESDAIIGFSDAQKLPFLQACITEALRIFGSVPMGLPRVVGPEGLTIGQQTFSKETIVSVNPHVIHQSKEIWGPDAREFRPDRWLSGDATMMQKSWIPFGAGYASCPGQNIARIELSKITATLVRDYDIWQKDKNQEWQYRAYFTVVPHTWPVYVKRSNK